MAGKEFTSQGDYITASFGQNGSVKDSGAKTFTGPFYAIYVTDDATVTSITYQTNQPSRKDTTDTEITSDTWTAGTWIFGNIQEFEISAGECEAFKK